MTNQKDLKPTNEVVALVLDHGYFPNLAESLSETFAECFYYTPEEQEFKDVEKCVIGDGLEKVQRLDEWLKPEHLDYIDLIVVPDLGFGPMQAHLRHIGKAVWGSMDGSKLEMSRTGFLKLIEDLNLPVVPYKVVVGVPKLREHLKGVEDKWVKLNKYRAQMETWHHHDYERSQLKLDEIDRAFGTLKHLPVFVVQDNIPTPFEFGYDGWCVDGKFPNQAFFGPECKNLAYCGSLLPYDELPEPIRRVNAAFAPVLGKMGYRNFMSTEIRIVDGVPYFIDPTLRMAGLTMEHQETNCLNLADVIWYGANGIVIEPEFENPFVAEATIHYTDGNDGWKFIRLPEEARKNVKLSYFCEEGSGFHFPPKKLDELGVIVGSGNTLEEAIQSVKDTAAMLEDEPIKADIDGFSELIDQVKEANAEGIKFSNEPLPDKTVLVNES